MNIVVQRFRCGKNATQGILYVDQKFECFTLEDVFHEKKVPKETRIPSGTYTVSLADYGDMNARYRVRFGTLHKGMVMLNNVPGFTGILIHMGNDKTHTEGCILVGNLANAVNETILESEVSYIKIYNLMAAELIAKRPVTITILDEKLGE